MTVGFHAPPAAAARMDLDVIRDWAEFEVLKDPWQALERRDPGGSIFLSWEWLAQAFRAHPGRWLVVVAHRGDRILGLLPLKTRLHWSTSQNRFETEIEAGGRLIWSEYTGLLCDPEAEQEVIAAMARRVQMLPWARLSLRYVDPPARAEAFLNAFPRDRFSAKWRDYRINGGETDNLICPRVELPDSHEDWLSGLPSKNMRQKIRRFTRRYLDSGELRIETAGTAGESARDLDHLLRFWLEKWAGPKGRGTAERVAANYREVLGTAQRLGLLHLPVLWQGDSPLGALGHVLDPSTGRVNFIVAGRDTTADAAQIGVLLHAESIRWAIDNGYHSYDFCHGDEAYKFTYGAEGHRVGYLSVRRRGADATAPRFDRFNAAEALSRMQTMIEAGQGERAVAACRQLASVLAGVPPHGSIS